MKNKTIITQYAEMIEHRLKSIKNIQGLREKDDSPELNKQMMMEIYSLNELLTSNYYTKLIKIEKKRLLADIVKNDRYGDKRRNVS